MNAEVIDVQGDDRIHLSGVDRSYMAHVILGAHTARCASEGYVESGSVTVAGIETRMFNFVSLWWYCSPTTFYVTHILGKILITVHPHEGYIRWSFHSQRNATTSARQLPIAKKPLVDGGLYRDEQIAYSQGRVQGPGVAV